MTLTADGNGHITGHFTIPPNIPIGAKSVEFIGATSLAQATFVGRGVIKFSEARQVTIKAPVGTAVWSGDPLAQTFTLGQATLISGVDIWFAAKGTSRVAVQLRECQVGYPTRTIITDCVLPPASINLTGHTRFTWPAVRLEADTEYAFVVLCDDAVTAVRIAELGQYDAAHQKWVTSQPYMIGVLFSSSNAGTWTAHQTQDMAFRLLTPHFSATTREITLPSVAVTAADHLSVMAAVERPLDTTDVRFQITVPGITTPYLVRESQPILLPAPFTGTITWKAILTGTSIASPRLHRAIQLIWAKTLPSSTYITRAIPANDATSLRVELTKLFPGSSSLAVALQIDDGASWTPVPLTATNPIGDGWEELTYALTSISAASVRVRLTLTGAAQMRPRVRNLKVLLT